MFATRIRTAFAWLACGLLLGSCGGGSGTPRGPDAVLEGPYFVSVFGAAAGPPDAASAAWGPGQADGAGSVSAALAINDTGTLLEAAQVSLTYAAEIDRSLVTTLEGATTFLGAVAEGGDLALGGSFSFDARPALLAYARADAEAGATSLDGAYHVCILALDPGTGTALSYWGSASFNGLGACDLQLTLNAQGTILGPGAWLAAPYGVDSTGRFEQSIQGGERLEGVVLRGGDLVLATGSTNDTWAPLLAVYVRKTTEASADVLRGRYLLVGLDRGDQGFRSITGEALADGHGLLTVELRSNTEGVLGLDEGATDGYTVAADGTLVLDPGFDEVTGGVTPDGFFAVMGGPATEGTAPGLYLLMRR